MKRNPPKPAPYPITDIAENEAIDVFKSLIDKRLVKDEIRSRDKIPNSDGWIELVDNEQRPTGKLDVQIRKIEAGAKKYSCPVELVAYSSKITSPFLLICVDTKSKKAYWKHITPSMPEYKYKDKQKTFTIHFSETVDVVDESGIYYQKWLGIVQHYQERINIPVFNSEFVANLDPNEINEVDRIWLQRFINSLNGLFSNEFASIKKTLYPGIAEFGVGIFSSNEAGLYFQLYEIPYGQTAPHICQMKGGSLWSKNINPLGIADFSSDRTEPPETIAKNFVLRDAAHIFQQMAFLPYSYLLAKDILFAFIDTYHSCLGLTPGKDKYSTEEINTALHHHLFKICAAYLKTTSPNTTETVVLELRDIVNYLRNKKLRPVNPKSIKTKFFIQSKHFPIRNAFEALSYLSAIDRYSIQRASSEPLETLNNSIEVYSEFLKANNINFLDSPYLNWKTTVVFEILPKDLDDSQEQPILREHHINNQKNKLAKLWVFARQKEEVLSFWETTPPRPIVDINGVRYNPESASEGNGSFLYETMPLFNMIYRMLAKDFKIHYDLDVNDKYFPLKS